LTHPKPLLNHFENLKWFTKTVIYWSGFQKGIFLCHVIIIFNIIRKFHHCLMFTFEWTWRKYVNKGLISHEVNIYAEVIIRQSKKNVKLDYRYVTVHHDIHDTYGYHWTCFVNMYSRNIEGNTKKVTNHITLVKEILSIFCRNSQAGVDKTRLKWK